MVGHHRGPPDGTPSLQTVSSLMSVLPKVVFPLLSPTQANNVVLHNNKPLLCSFRLVFDN